MDHAVSMQGRGRELGSIATDLGHVMSLLHQDEKLLTIKTRRG
ncbi:hypothetical protein B932_2975 [Gluconobacter oxydans H24]|nr:hypothetical protein B932_2975 [Gluconobacter oxydans H24]